MRGLAFGALFFTLTFSVPERLPEGKAELLIPCFDTVLSLPTAAPQDVFSMLVAYGRSGKYEHAVLTLRGKRLTVILVGMPWGAVRPAVIIFHKSGRLERTYWSDSEGASTRAWDRERGLRELKPCSGGCLTTEICFPFCPFSSDGAKNIEQRE